MCPVDGVGAYSGEDRVDYWNKAKWDQELKKYQVRVMLTAENIIRYEQPGK